MSVRISLVFPLAQERNLTANAITAWTRQTLPADQFEVIVVVDDRAALDPQVQALLRPHDQVLCGQFANLAHQFDAGARAGSGEFLFLTESHCLSAPDCLEAMDRFLVANPQVVGACCESVPVWESAYQLIDATTFEEGYRQFLRTNDWRKLNVHGMALRRDAYLAHGGLQHQYGRFAEMLLAAALRDSGDELGYARESIVTHHYRDSLQELIDGTEEYVTSECSYRAAHPGPDRVGHTYLPDMPDPCSPGAAALNREVVATLLGGAFGRKTILMQEALIAAGRDLARRFGRRGIVLSAWIALAITRVRCWRNRHDAARLDVPYRELIRRASILSRTRFLASHRTIDAPLPESPHAITLDKLPEWALLGFHGMERVNGEPFRWTGRVAAIRLPLVKGEYRLRLMTRGVRQDGMNLRVAFNGKRMTPVALPGGDYELHLERWHCHEREQTLMLVSDPLCPWKEGVKDYRELGLPLFAIEAVPLVAELKMLRRTAA